MKLGQVQIWQTFAQIGIDTVPARSQIKTGLAEVRQQMTLPLIQIKQTLPQLEIDLQKMRDDFHMKTPVDFVKDNADEAYREGLKAIRHISAYGDDMARIDLRRDPRKVIADQARARANQTPSFGYGVLPGFNSVEMTFIPGELQVDYLPATFTLDVETHFPEATYQRGKVDIYLKQKHAIEIDTNLRAIDFVI
jgi:hypothetical protein